MDAEDKNISEFYDDFPYAVLYINWDGLRITRCKTKEYMEKVFDEYNGFYKYVQKIEVEKIVA